MADPPKDGYAELRDRERGFRDGLTDAMRYLADFADALLAVGERDKAEIERLTEALNEAERVIRVTAGWNPDRVSVLQAIEPAADYLRAAGEGDTTGGIE